MPQKMKVKIRVGPYKGQIFEGEHKWIDHNRQGVTIPELNDEFEVPILLPQKMEIGPMQNMKIFGCHITQNIMVVEKSASETKFFFQAVI